MESDWLFVDEVDVFVGCVHKILFARVTLEAVGLVERLNLSLGLVGSFAVHVTLLLEFADIPAAAHELNDTLFADEEKDNGEEEDCNHIFEPFLRLNARPKIGNFHMISGLVG